MTWCDVSKQVPTACRFRSPSFNVPVVMLLDAYYLPNWQLNHTVGHFITIIGYNDDAGTYDYVDTCAKITGCGSLYNGTVRTALQSTIYTAAYNYGGGWAW
jgi:hypothetical protein